MSPNTGLHAHIELQEWVVKHGGYLHQSVQLARNESRGVHIQVKPEWPSSVQGATCVIKVPVKLTMSYLNAVDFRPPSEGGTESPFSSRGVTFPRSFLDAVGPEETTAFFLMGQYLKGTEGFWHPYLRTLPRADELTTPLHFEEEDMEWLNGTSLYAAREQRLQSWRHSYESSLKTLKEAGMDGLGGYSWQVFSFFSFSLFSPFPLPRFRLI
jgi:hypothetical protein